MKRDRQPRILAIIGPTGVGKSTDIELLVPQLISKGYKVSVTQLRINHLAAGLLTRVVAFLSARGRKDMLPLGALCEEKPIVLKRLFKLWMVLDVASISAKFFLRVYLPKRLGRLVIVEDYMPVSIADHIYLCRRLGLPDQGFPFFTNCMLKLMRLGGPTNLVMLEAELSSLSERQSRRGSWGEVGEYIMKQRLLLRTIIEQLPLWEEINVDTSHLSAIQVRDRILDNLANVL